MSEENTPASTPQTSTSKPFNQRLTTREHTMYTPTENPQSSDSLTGSTSTKLTEFIRHPARVGTIIWGVVVIVAGILIIISTQFNVDLDAGLTVMWLLLGSGLAMVTAGAVNLLRRSRH